MNITPLMGISFEELEGSPRVVINQHGLSATRSFRVAWNDWQAFARELIGTWRIIGNATQFVPPIAFPGLANLIVSELQLEPFDGTGPDGGNNVSLGAFTNTYTAGGARVTAVYRTMYDEQNLDRADLPAVPQGTYLTYASELSAESIVVPGRIFKWLGTSPAERVPDDQAPGILIPTGSHTLSWQRVLRPPWTAIRSLRGKVNSAPFLSAPAGTVLFLGAQATRQFQFVIGGGFWQIEYRFTECTKELTTGSKVGWNFFYKEQKVGNEHWVEIKDLDDRSPYLGGDFSQLFAFGG